MKLDGTEESQTRTEMAEHRSDGCDVQLYVFCITSTNNAMNVSAQYLRKVIWTDFSSGKPAYGLGKYNFPITRRLIIYLRSWQMMQLDALGISQFVVHSL